MFLHHVSGRHLGIFHQSAAPVAVHIDGNVPPVEPRYTECAEKGVRQLLPLDAGIVSRPIARLVNLVEVGRAEKLVVIVEFPFVMAEIADWCVEFLMVWAAGKT